ncbi:MAG: hypothetical protein ACFE0I_16840 [Elainellaceae cyanobacterium]
MKPISTVVSTTIAALSCVVAASSLMPARAASLSFDVYSFTGDSAKAKITLTEVGEGVKFAVDVVPSPNIGDLRGVFFNIADDSLLSGLSITGLNLGTTQFNASSVINLGGGATLSGYSGGNFDAGVEIGKSGIGKGDDFQSAMFTVSHSSAVLTLEQFANQYFGVRITSVGLSGTARNGSSKLAGQAPVLPEKPDTSEDPTEVPEPSAALALGLVAIGAQQLRRQG